METCDVYPLARLMPAFENLRPGTANRAPEILRAMLGAACWWDEIEYRCDEGDSVRPGVLKTGPVPASLLGRFLQSTLGTNPNCRVCLETLA